MNIEELQARIVELESSLQDVKDINAGLLEKQRGFEETIRGKDERISNLIDKNTDLFLRVSQPVVHEEPEVLKAPEPKQEETITFDDILG